MRKQHQAQLSGARKEHKAKLAKGEKGYQDKLSEANQEKMTRLAKAEEDCKAKLAEVRENFKARLAEIVAANRYQLIEAQRGHDAQLSHTKEEYEDKLAKAKTKSRNGELNRLELEGSIKVVRAEWERLSAGWDHSSAALCREMVAREQITNERSEIQEDLQKIMRDNEEKTVKLKALKSKVDQLGARAG